MSTSNTLNIFNAESYLSRLARGGVVVYTLGSEVCISPVMESGEATPLGTIKRVEAHAKEIAEFFDAQDIYPFLTPGEFELSKLVLDTLDAQELERYQAHQALYEATPEGAGDSQECLTVRQAPFRVRGASKADAREFHPPYHETPQDRRLRVAVESLDRLAATTARKDESVWSFEAGESIKWVKRVKPDGSKSLHFIAWDEDTQSYRCDCAYKSVRQNEACVHELARTGELERRSNNE